MNNQEHRQEYTPVQISFDLGCAVHREALFQVLLTLEHAEEEAAQADIPPFNEEDFNDDIGEVDDNANDDDDYPTPPSYGDIGDDPNG